MLANIYDVLTNANWQRSGGKNARPQPFPRPGIGPEQRHIGNNPLPIDEMDEWLKSRIA